MKNPLIFAYIFSGVVMFGTASYSAVKVAQDAMSANFTAELVSKLVEYNGLVAIAMAMVIALQFLQQKIEEKNKETQ